MGSLIRQVESLEGKQWDPTGGGSKVDMSAPANQRWTVASSIYFVLATITTTGYGDMQPKTLFGQILAVIVTVVGGWFLIRTLLGLARSLENGKSGHGSYDPGFRSKHILVVGGASFQVLRDFILEIYHEDHAAENQGLNMVILLLPGQIATKKALQNYLGKKENRALAHKIWVLSGTALKQQDLNRARFDQASAAFMLPNIYASDAEREDLENVMRALSMRRHVPYVRLVALLLKAEHRDMMLSVGMGTGDVICADEMKLGLLGKSCEVGGFVTLACTLFKNTGESESASDAKTEKPAWLEPYMDGLGNELYELNLSPAYVGAPFGEVAVDILKRSGGAAYLIGVIEEPLFPRDLPVTSFFPGRHAKVGTAEDRRNKGIFIAKDRTAIRQYPPGKMFPWHMDEEMRTASAQGGVAADANLPNAVASAVTDTGGPAMAGKEGWVKEAGDTRRAQDSKVFGAMATTASRRAVIGLRQRAGATKEAAEDMLGEKLAPGEGDGKGGSLAAEDEVQKAKDPSKQAVLAEQLKANREEEAELAMLESEAEDATEAKALLQAKKMLSYAEAKEDALRRAREPSQRDRDEEEQLWGQPPDPPPTLWGNPQEPPNPILMRGGHVVILALEGEKSTERSLPAEIASLATGKPLGLKHFIRSLRAGARHKRPVVVIATRVPEDWPEVSQMPQVYLVLGHPFSSATLTRSGFEQATAVVIHQRSVAIANEPSTIDAAAVFACRLVESLLVKAGKHIPVICDIMLERNAYLMNHSVEKPKDEDDEFKEKKLEEDMKNSPFYMQSRYLSGRLFVSSIVTSLSANMLYNPSLSSVFTELIGASYVVLPVPEVCIGQTFGDLFEFMMRKRNLLPMALVRRLDAVEKFEMDDEEQDAGQPDAPGARHGHGQAVQWAKRWTPGEPPASRFVFVMPAGHRFSCDDDGVMCMMPTASRAILPPGVTLGATVQPGAAWPPPGAKGAKGVGKGAGKDAGKGAGKGAEKGAHKGASMGAVVATKTM